MALRLYYSFRAPGADRLILGDIGRFFPNREMATFAFEIFDKDENGDATREEMEAAVMEIHTERQSLAASMKDIDSATSRLDDILLALYFIVVLLIFAIMLVSFSFGTRSCEKLIYNLGAFHCRRTRKYLHWRLVLVLSSWVYLG